MRAAGPRQVISLTYSTTRLISRTHSDRVLVTLGEIAGADVNSSRLVSDNRIMTTGLRLQEPPEEEVRPDLRQSGPSLAKYPRVARAPIRFPKLAENERDAKGGKRPNLGRPDSTVYTTLDLTPPRTPADEHAHKSWIGSWIGSRNDHDAERGRLVAQPDELKWSRECFVSEFKCYGKVLTPSLFSDC